MATFAQKASTLLITTQLFVTSTGDSVNYVSLLNILDTPVDINSDIDLTICNGLVAIASINSEPSNDRAFPTLENIKDGIYCLMSDDNAPKTITAETFDIVDSAITTYSLKELIDPKKDYLSRLIDHLMNKAAHEGVSYDRHIKRISELGRAL